MAEQITLRYEGRVAIITLNRPEVLNALDGDCYYLLGERLREIDKREDIYITVLTGAGRFFSAWVYPINLPDLSLHDVEELIFVATASIVELISL